MQTRRAANQHKKNIHSFAGLNNGVTIPVPYDNGTQSITWAYTADYNAWVASGFVPAAVPSRFQSS